MLTKDENIINEFKIKNKFRKIAKLKARLLIDKDKRMTLDNLMAKYEEGYNGIKHPKLTIELHDKIMQEEDLVYYECKGYPCIIHRGVVTGCLNGYVGIRKTESFISYMDCDDICRYISAHGGLNFTSHGGEDIWYKVDDDGNELFWIGFDCGHFGDFIPYVPYCRGTYKDIEFIKEAIEKVVDQLEKFRDEGVEKYGLDKKVSK